MPDPEVPERPRRRRFSAAYKLAVLRETDAATEDGQIGAILRRERLYSSHVNGHEEVATFGHEKSPPLARGLRAW